MYSICMNDYASRKFNKKNIDTLMGTFEGFINSCRFSLFISSCPFEEPSNDKYLFMKTHASIFFVVREICS
jgi:hypothetical protein